jgi:hypothetical protein
MYKVVYEIELGSYRSPVGRQTRRRPLGPTREKPQRQLAILGTGRQEAIEQKLAKSAKNMRYWNFALFASFCP